MTLFSRKTSVSIKGTELHSYFFKWGVQITNRHVERLEHHHSWKKIKLKPFRNHFTLRRVVTLKMSKGTACLMCKPRNESWAVTESVDLGSHRGKPRVFPQGRGTKLPWAVILTPRVSFQRKIKWAKQNRSRYSNTCCDQGIWAILKCRNNPHVHQHLRQATTYFMTWDKTDIGLYTHEEDNIEKIKVWIIHLKWTILKY